MGRAGRDPRAAAAPSSRAGVCRGRGELGLLARAGRWGWVVWTFGGINVWHRLPEAFASRAPSCERAGPRRAWEPSGPSPLSPAWGHSPAVRPTRGARRPGPARATWPCEGRRPGPPPPSWPSRDFSEPPVARRAQHSGCLPFSLPLASSFHCPPGVVVPAPAPSPTSATVVAAPTFADVELSLPFLRRVPFSLAEKRKK